MPNVLLDPTLDVVDSMGVTVSNDNWRDTQEEVTASTIPPNDVRESAIDIISCRATTPRL
jgi:hypothetical protein